jgi:hypothetical protein
MPLRCSLDVIGFARALRAGRHHHRLLSRRQASSYKVADRLNAASITGSLTSLLHLLA